MGYKSSHKCLAKTTHWIQFMMYVKLTDVQKR